MKFLTQNKRFSFKLGDAYSWDLPYTTESVQEGNTITTTYLFEGGLKITNIAKKYEKYHAYEWVNYIENTSDIPTDIISELWDCDCILSMEHENPRVWETYFPDVKTATKIYAPSGSTWSLDEFFSDPDLIRNNARSGHIYPGMTKTYTAFGGRSSETNAPFFNIHKNGKGYIFAVGWTGQWNCSVTRSEDAITFRSKIEDTHFKVMPGEKFRTSSVVFMEYEGDVLTSQNKWRRLVKEHFSLIGQEGRETHGPLCASVWGGMRSKTVIEHIKKIRELGFPFEYIWMDAGWYGINTTPSADEFGDDWGALMGDWQVSPLVHPQGLKDVSKAVHDAGMKFLLWFEPERVLCNSPIVSTHPEYFITNHELDDEHCLMNLGNKNAWNFCFEQVANLIETLKLDYYRQDFNFWPLEFWRKNDEPDRKGITEIKHINGMYRLWDSLLNRFPALMIDNCSSGGRRIDIETLRRSVPLWRSDYQCPANYDVEAAQCHTMTYNAWMPYSGTGTGRLYDKYRIRSAYATSLNTSYTYSSSESFCDTEEKTAFIQKYTAEYLRVRPYFSEDFYPLTKFSNQDDTWCAMQYDRPSAHDGMIQVFRRKNAPYEIARFFLYAIDQSKTYVFTDLDGGEFTVSGKGLVSEGLKLELPQKEMAKIYLYHTLN